MYSLLPVGSWCEDVSSIELYVQLPYDVHRWTGPKPLVRPKPDTQCQNEPWATNESNRHVMGLVGLLICTSWPSSSV